MSDVLLDTDSVARWLSDAAESPPLRETLHDVALYAAMLGVISTHHPLLDAVGDSRDNPPAVPLADIRAEHRDTIERCLAALVGTNPLRSAKQGLTRFRFVGADNLLTHEFMDRLSTLDRTQLDIVSRSVEIMCRYPELHEMLCDSNRERIAGELLKLLVDDPTDDEIAAYVRSWTELPECGLSLDT